MCVVGAHPSVIIHTHTRPLSNVRFIHTHAYVADVRMGLWNGCVCVHEFNAGAGPLRLTFRCNTVV